MTFDYITVGNGPSAIALSPNGTRLYVTNATDNSVSVINTATKGVVATIALGNGNRPRGVAVSPDGGRVYVTNYDTATVTVINTATNAIIDTKPDTPAVDYIRLLGGQSPLGVVVSPDGSRVYVVNSLGGVNVIDTATYTIIDTKPATTQVIDPIAAGTTAEAGALSPDGSRLYVTNRTQVMRPEGTLTVVDTVALTAIDLNPTTPAVDPTTVGIGPTGVAVSTDGSHVYVTNGGSDNVTVLDATTNSVVGTIPVGDQPIGIVIRGNFAYVANQISRSVTVIDTTSNTVVGTIPVLFQPVGIAVSPDGSSVYLVNGQFNPGTVTVVSNVSSGIDV